KKESSATSAVLFLNAKGEPMRFFIRPGPTKVQLQPLISNGGGILCRNQESDAILLANPGDITSVVQGAGHFYISTQYVHDCVAQNQQLDLESYRFSNVQPVRTRAASRKHRATGRMGYSKEDDTAILNFITKHQKEAKGNRIWQQMELQGITAHSWQSMKDRFLKHLQHRLKEKSHENKKKVSSLKESSSSELSISQSTQQKQKAGLVSSFDSDATQISQEKETGAKEQPDLQASPEETNDLQDSQLDEVRKETDGNDPTSEKEQPSDNETPEVSLKRARMDTDSPAEDPQHSMHLFKVRFSQVLYSFFVSNDPQTSVSLCLMYQSERRCSAVYDLPIFIYVAFSLFFNSGPSEQTSPPRENHQPSAPSGLRCSILERAAREFEDSQANDGSQQDQSQAPSRNASDTDESQIMAARQRAIMEQEVNPEHPHVTDNPSPVSQNHSNTPGPEDDEDEDTSPSSAALPTTSNAHMFLFQQESQEDFSQPSEEDLLSQSLLETQQHVIRLMQESKKNLVEVMKGLLKVNGDVSLARSYLLEGYDAEVHGRIWTREDDEILRSANSLQFKRLHEKYGAKSVSKRAAFLKVDL
ncbi:telomeric repeat-binding factor 2-interacting protein 1 isoform X1, partial [Silurus asotus]